ncbi:hypothetical protein [Priestia taiwanensis]|uniref:Uncharacterized protein n=1 Tax=Priestia taiwanensis TaxID=1347902 RepID=A0A917ASV7_9BACI|nr:hypothetical protein [Priestia taiwanensis]MBM7364102.1 hypothetical protein [Priestia taiwanensis]GGE71608.1 hypothetical protein GCM10007140_21950 [Priestia taiwanensis]
MSKYTFNITRDSLWKGCVLRSIAYAIGTAQYPEFSNESSWDGFNYSMQDSTGARGTITFHPDYCIVAFQDLHSERCQALEEATHYIRDASEALIQVAEKEAFQYLLDEVEGETIPVVTTAFWIEDDKAYSMDTYEDFEEHSGSLADILLVDFETAKEVLEEEFEFEEEQMHVLESLYERKISYPNERIILSKREIAMLGAEDPEGLEESRECFEEMNIYWGTEEDDE